MPEQRENIWGVAKDLFKSKLRGILAVVVIGAAGTRPLRVSEYRELKRVVKGILRWKPVAP